MGQRDSLQTDHLKIADYIVQKIMKKEICPGERIPSYHQLARKFHANLNVVRSALVRLENLGWITPVKGKGCFVNDRPKMIRTTLSKFDRYTTNMIERGEKPNAHLLDWCLDEPTLEERDFLTLSGTDKVYRLEILRFIGLTPLGLTTSVLPETVVPGLERHLESFRSLHGLLEKHYDFVPFKKSSILEARMPSVHEAELLEIPENVPIFWKVNLLINAEGLPVELDFFRNRGDLIQYVVDYDKVDVESQRRHPIE